MDIDKYKHDDWIVYWSGDKWSPLGFSYWVTLNTRKLFSKKYDIDYFVEQTIMVWDGEATTCYIRESAREVFGKKIAKKVIDDETYIDAICNGFRNGTDHILKMYKKAETGISYEDYKSYLDYFIDNYYIYHLQVKNVADFLPKDILDKHFKKLEEARVHAEPLFSQEIGYMKKIAEQVAKDTNYGVDNILQVFVNEFIDYWRDGKKLPEEKILEERNKGCVVFFEDGQIKDVLTGKEIENFSSIFLNTNNNESLKGNTAFKGKVRGIVRIIFDPSNVKEFNDGDILVAPWTRPEYLPIMKKAGAFVTDGGGMLSHAAIVARELKKPCVIATKTATKLLKDGDMVEVDADNGIIKKLNKE